MSQWTGADLFYTYSNPSSFDWDGRLNIEVPASCRVVEMEFFPGGTKQTGSDSTVLMRFNEDTGSNYWQGITKWHDGSSYTSDNGGTVDAMQIHYTTNLGANNSCTQVSFNPNKNDLGVRGYTYVLQKTHMVNNAGKYNQSRFNRWENTVDRVSSVQLYALGSGSPSFSVTVRFL